MGQPEEYSGGPFSQRLRRGLRKSHQQRLSFQIEHSNIFICMNYDGTIQFASGMMEMGTGLKTTLIQIAAEVLGTDTDHISAIMGDTNINVADMGAQASRGLYVTGHAVKNAAENLRSDMLRYAEERLHMDKGVLRLKIPVSAMTRARCTLPFPSWPMTQMTI